MTRWAKPLLKFYIIGLVVVTLLLTGCGGTVQLQVNRAGGATISPEPVIIPVATPPILDNGWYQYRDPQIGYAFSYPPETKVKIGQSRFGNNSAQLQFKLPGVIGYQGMTIRVEANPNDLPIDQMLAELYQRSAQEIAPEELLAQVEVITVAGQPALKTTILPTNTEFSILFLYNNRVYILAPVHGPTAKAVNPEALELFYEIVETISVNS